MIRIVASALALLAAVAAPTAAQVAQPPTAAAPVPALPTVQAVEIGAGLGVYDSGFGTANEQFLRYRVSRIDDFSFAADLGREQRFDDLSLRGGVTFSKSLQNGPTFTAGWSAGSGDIVAPRYRFDVGVTQPIRGALTSFTYTRLQSKAVNATDGYTLGVVRWFSQWIIQGYGRVEVGSPGRTISPSAMVGATWYRWKKLYIGGDLSFGSVSYILLPGDLVGVDYKAIAGTIVVSRWFDERSGLNVRANIGDTDIYRMAIFTVSVFREF